jgi:glycosyltransferase involved in cell wall biosynthesis
LIVEHRSFFVWITPEARQMVKPFYLPFFEAAYRHCHRLVPVSESLLTGLRSLMPWIDEKVEVIPNMIRESMFLPPSVPRECSPFVFFWAGRLEHVKGIDVLLEAVDELNARTDSSFLVRLAGRGSLRTQLEEQAMELGINHIVSFLGRISREEMQEELQNACCFVLPTRYEAFGAVLIEAMATGMPVIATRSGGPDHIVSVENGFLVEPDNVKQLATAMERMMQEYVSFNQDQIRSTTLERFGEKKVLERYGRLFLEISTNSV